jgi:hypothetical protein
MRLRTSPFSVLKLAELLRRRRLPSEVALDDGDENLQSPQTRLVEDHAGHQRPPRL